MCADRAVDPSVPHEGYAPVENGTLFYREIGQGQPSILLHGGPDFDHLYLRPDMDRLSDAYRLIYYDQRGRGKSAPETQPDAVGIETEVEDLDRLRAYLQLDSVAVLGHSWGGLLAMEYAIRHPNRVSHLILMNTAAASHQDLLLLRQEVRRRKALHQQALDALLSSAAYQDGDPDAVTAYYRIHFGTTILRQAHLERVLQNMQQGFTKENVLRGRAIEERLYADTWASNEYDLFPRLRQLQIPTLILHGDHDFIPVACAIHIAEAIPGAQFRLLSDCGHFAYMEAPDAVRQELDAFFAGMNC